MLGRISINNVDTELLKVLRNLSLCSDTVITTLFDEDVFDMLIPILADQNWNQKVYVIKIMQNLILKVEYSVLENMIVKGYMSALKEEINQVSTKDVVYWTMIWIKTFLNRDLEGQEFAMHFQNIGGTNILEEIEGNTPNDIYEIIEDIMTRHYHADVDACEIINENVNEMH
jgi:hypothetical protein